MDLHEIQSQKLLKSNNVDDDYIDMEVNISSSPSSSSSSFFSFSLTSSPPQNREFEFQMCSSAVASGESTTSPADELFYKGQLLPLHLPPRLQMVKKLLESSSVAVTNTPISPRAAASTRAAASPRATASPRKLSTSEIVIPDEQCFFEISTDLIENENQVNIKRIKQSSILTQKLKASRAYLKALFTRPACSDSLEIHQKSKLENIKRSKSSKKNNPFDEMKNSPLIHRRSFSGVIQRHYCPAKCSSSSSSSASSLSSSFSFGSNGSLDLQTLMRSSNASSEIDNFIEGAIEHCKQSFSPRKSNVVESELCSSRTSVSTCSD